MREEKQEGAGVGGGEREISWVNSLEMYLINMSKTLSYATALSIEYKLEITLKMTDIYCN